MTPKEKAKEIVEKYHKLGKDFTRGVSMQEFSKECALICVNEVLGYMGADRGYLFWSDVKDEIKKL
jgi:hypothetical protein